MQSRRGVKFQSEFLGAATAPNQRVSARHPVQGRPPANASTARTPSRRQAARTSIAPSAGNPASGGRVQVEGIDSRLTNPLIDSLLQ